MKVWSMRENPGLQKCLRGLKKLLRIMLLTVIASTPVVGALYFMVADWANKRPFKFIKALVAYLIPEEMSGSIIVLSSKMLLS